MTRGRSLTGLLLIGLGVPVVLAGVVAISWWWFARPQSVPFRIVLKGSSGYSGNTGVSGGNLVVVAPKPGILFGTVRKPDSQEEQFTYLILFRYGRPESDETNRGLQFHCSSDGDAAETNDAIELDGKRIEAVYRVAFNDARTAVDNESLTIGGKGVDMASGQVFLIDLSDEAPVYRQKKLELPVISSRLESPQDVERLAEKIRQSLESQDPEIKAFLQ